MPKKVNPARMFGRTQILSSATYIDETNVIEEVIRKGYVTHLNNRVQIDYLYDYYKGKQPILFRTKSIRSDIKNMIVENRANEIVNFKTGYLVGSPVQYVSRNNKGGQAVSDAVDALNDMMLSESKEAKDKELVEWQMICGTAYRFALPTDDEDVPFKIYGVDPRFAFVIYSNTIDKRPLAGVYYTTDENNQINTYSVYTENMYFEIEHEKIVTARPHILGMIPIIEYPANNARLGAFEPVLPMLDAINTIDSNRIDGIEQFVQSLVVLYNAELPDGEDATTLQEKGLVCLKSSGENKADIKIMSETLSQADTQTLKRDMYQTVLEIVGMPSQGNGQTGDSSNNGAVILRQGWYGAEARAKDSELMFKQSERQFLKLILNITNTLAGTKLNVSDIEAHFTRRQYEDIGSKASVLTMLLGSEKVAPKLAFEASGLFIDSEEAYQESMAWYEEQKAEADARMERQAEIAAMNENDEQNTEEETTTE